MSDRSACRPLLPSPPSAIACPPVWRLGSAVPCPGCATHCCSLLSAARSAFRSFLSVATISSLDRSFPSRYSNLTRSVSAAAALSRPTSRSSDLHATSALVTSRLAASNSISRLDRPCSACAAVVVCLEAAAAASSNACRSLRNSFAWRT